MFMIGNKSDLVRFRDVSTEEALEFKNKNDILCFCETSAKSGDNVEKMFVNIAKLIYLKYKERMHKMLDDENSSQSSSRTGSEVGGNGKKAKRA